MDKKLEGGTIMKKVTQSISSCNRCHRKITNPISIERGYGPVCRSKMVTDVCQEIVDQVDYKLGGCIILRRVNGRAVANIPHTIKRHSPTGFEWGYGGSGPADLALNILYAVTGDKEKAYNLYQDFKWDFISKVPHDGGIINKLDILKWLKRKEVEKPC